MPLTLLAAVAQNGALGRNNELLWHLPEDLSRFKALTLGHTVAMGRKTWDSLPRKPLPGRRNIVLTRHATWRAPGATPCTSAEEILALPQPAYIIGGAEIYALFLPHAAVMELTEIHASPADADTFFPPFNKAEWERTVTKTVPPQGQTPGYTFATLRRRA